ncbi:MAG: divergent PAP2 family protein [Treponema sp.]|jgi:acid phosphatase family membrane protein YuiD|nr:divergent PAP2 family protein [Treponema sp.]
MIVTATLKSLFGNLIFLSTISSLFIAQVLKLLFNMLKHKSKKVEIDVIETILWRTGGMPSSHSAVVCSLATSAGIKEGFASNLFIISLIFAMIVLRDALGVRRSAGIQAKTLNSLGKQTAKKIDIEFNTVKEIQGHTPLEVIVGSFLGIVIAIIFHLVLASKYQL